MIVPVFVSFLDATLIVCSSARMSSVGVLTDAPWKAHLCEIRLRAPLYAVQAGSPRVSVEERVAAGKGVASRAGREAADSERKLAICATGRWQ